MGTKKRQGFTLIELLAVVFILAVGLASISALFVAGIVSSKKAQRMSIAANVSRKQMERIRGGGYASCIIDADVFTEADGYTITQDNGDGTGEVSFVVPQLPSGAGTVEIAYYNSGAGIYPNLKDVSVTVTWAGGTPMQGTTVLHTYVANHP